MIFEEGQKLVNETANSKILFQTDKMEILLLDNGQISPFSPQKGLDSTDAYIHTKLYKTGSFG